MAFGRRSRVWLAIAVIALAAGARWGWITGIVSVLAIAAIVDLVVHQHFRKADPPPDSTPRS